MIAVVAFEIGYNKILEWACAQRGVSSTFSYCCGVADGLLLIAHEEKERESARARSKGQARELQEKLEEEPQGVNFALKPDMSAKGTNIFV